MICLLCLFWVLYYSNVCWAIDTLDGDRWGWRGISKGVWVRGLHVLFWHWVMSVASPHNFTVGLWVNSFMRTLKHVVHEYQVCCLWSWSRTGLGTQGRRGQLLRHIPPRRWQEFGTGTHVAYLSCKAIRIISLMKKKRPKWTCLSSTVRVWKLIPITDIHDFSHYSCTIAQPKFLSLTHLSFRIFLHAFSLARSPSPSLTQHESWGLQSPRNSSHPKTPLPPVMNHNAKANSW